MTSIRAARRAGLMHAAVAMPHNTAEITSITHGSDGVTPYSCDASTRPNATDAVAPTATPTTVSESPSRSTSATIAPGALPTAMRIPISRLRCATRYASMPYTPSADRNTPTAAKSMARCIVLVRGDSARSARSESVRMSNNGTSWSIRASAVRTS